MCKGSEARYGLRESPLKPGKTWVHTIQGRVDFLTQASSPTRSQVHVHTFEPVYV